MAKSQVKDSSKPASTDQKTSTKKHKSYYFINEIVEDKLRRYLWTGCTSVILRDSIMEHASELIRQIIRKQGLQNIYPGQEESSFGDLLQTAWVQIEKTLYKYRARPHCRNCFNEKRPEDSLLYRPPPEEYGIIDYTDLIITLEVEKCPKCSTVLDGDESIDYEPLRGITVKPAFGVYGGSETVLYRGNSKVFNMWSQVARTVILAYIKKENRDRKNSNSYLGHLDSRPKKTDNTISRFISEAKEVCQHNDDYLSIISAFEHLYTNDEKPHDGIIGKLVEKSGKSRTTVTSFLRYVRLCGHQFTDSPINKMGDSRRTAERRYDPPSGEDDE